MNMENERRCWKLEEERCEKMWRDIALTNKQSIANALLKLEQNLAHIRENLDTRELEKVFNRAHKLRTRSQRCSVTEKH